MAGRLAEASHPAGMVQVVAVTAADEAGVEDTGWEFPVSQARMQRTTSYTEMNTVLVRRTGVREFDFDLDGEQRAMGELLGQLSERSFGQGRLLISSSSSTSTPTMQVQASTTSPRERRSSAPARPRTRS